MVRPDFLMRSLIMPSLKAQLFLVKKLSWLFQRPVTATVAAVAAEAAFLLLRRRLMRLCAHVALHDVGQLRHRIVPNQRHKFVGRQV